MLVDTWQRYPWT